MGDSGIGIAPTGVWLTLQLAALALAAWRVPLAAQYPQPGEFQAVRVMLAAQFAGLALLFPWLLPNVRMLWVTVAAGWVMLLAAGALAAWPLTDVAPAAAFLTLWILVLATVRAAIPPSTPMTASALACLYIVGGPLLAYFHQEFATSPAANPDLTFGPLFSAISTPHHLPPQAWAQAAGIGIIGFVALVARRKTQKSAPLSSIRPS
ncbi:MAG TPA: hypothetical protein VGI81_06895 [Tepidisphaeraceae bacterium]